MGTIIFLTPLILVVLAIFIVRSKFRRGPIRLTEIVLYGCAIVAAAALPLQVGVWIPDFLGIESKLNKMEASTGHEIAVVQRWNYRDFYTTAVVVRNPDGDEHETIVDGDDRKEWAAVIELDESTRSAIISLKDRLPFVIEW